MIKRYNKTSLSDFFNYNDPKIAEWADNVYEKIRQTGELAGYVERHKDTRSHLKIVDGTVNPPISVVDGRFTFGKSYSGDLLTLDNGVRNNIGRIYDIEFEILFNEPNFIDIFLMDEAIVIHNTPSIIVHGLTFTGFTFVTGKVYQIHIVRNNISVSLYIDKVLIGTQILDSDIDTEFAVLYKSDQGSLPDTFTLSVNSLNPNSDVAITTANLDINGDSNGNTQFNRIYEHGSTVVFTAPLTTPDNNFKRWVLDGINQPQGLTTVSVTMNTNHTITAVYVVPSIFYNTRRSQLFTRNNCIGGLVGSGVEYVVEAGVYSSLISQADADAQAQADINSNGQGYANDNGTCSVIYWNVEKSQSFTRNNCETGYSGSSVNYVVAAHTYSSLVSQIDADNQALADIASNGQNYANTHGVCNIYFNEVQSQDFTRNNCGSGYTGSGVTYTVAAGTYSSSISQADANNQALSDIAANGQDNANTIGTCMVVSRSMVHWVFNIVESFGKHLQVKINGITVVNVFNISSSQFAIYEGDVVDITVNIFQSGSIGHFTTLTVSSSGFDYVDVGSGSESSYTFTWTATNGDVFIEAGSRPE